MATRRTTAAEDEDRDDEDDCDDVAMSAWEEEILLSIP